MALKQGLRFKLNYLNGGDIRNYSIFHSFNEKVPNFYFKDQHLKRSFKFNANSIKSPLIIPYRESSHCFTCRLIHENFLNPKFHRIVGASLSKFSTNNKSVPRTVHEVEENLSKDTFSPPDAHLLKISIIGVPNCGKSTLINNLIKWRVCSISPKVHTTVRNARAVLNDDVTQLVFLDTPGIVSPEEIKKYKLKGSVVVDPELSLQHADVIVVMHDVSNKYTTNQLHPGILRLLTLYPRKKSILVLNKVDILKTKLKLLEIVRDLTIGKLKDSRLNINKPKDAKKLKAKLAEIDSNFLKYADNRLPEENCFGNSTTQPPIEAGNGDPEVIHGDYRYLEFDDVLQGNLKLTEEQVRQFITDKKGWPGFDEVFMVSALTGLGIYELRKFFLLSAYPSTWMFTGDTVTDQTPQEMAINTVREKCLKHLSHNIPYELKFDFLHWELSESEVLSILIRVSCASESHVKLLIGRSGAKVKAIANEAEQELRDTFRTEVKLRLNMESSGEPKSKTSNKKQEMSKNKRRQKTQFSRIAPFSPGIGGKIKAEHIHLES